MRMFHSFSSFRDVLKIHILLTGGMEVTSDLKRKHTYGLEEINMIFKDEENG